MPIGAVPEVELGEGRGWFVPRVWFDRDRELVSNVPLRSGAVNDAEIGEVLVTELTGAVPGVVPGGKPV